MNFSLAPHSSLAAPRSRISAGVAISLILHALLILGYRYTRPAPAENLSPPNRMTVWLQPLKPTQAASARSTTPQASVNRSHTSPSTTSKAPTLQRQPAPIVAMPAAADAPSATTATAEASTSKAADPLHPETRREGFDMQAALKMARKEANRKDPARAAMPVSQLDDHPLYPEQSASELARNIDSAKRPSCLKGGSIFSPLIWLMDKKDSGCKF
ncbi:hypothetical protein [Duganella fentianensis]|uniref:hypothetical protein n=1 Tax=Duganella fentianensis TaxID=2692177 RepID=UPI0032B1C82B